MHALQKLLTNADITCRSYSGRSMYGAECLGAKAASLGAFLKGLLIALEEQDVSPNEWHEVQDAIKRITTDQMGYDTIVYFPGVPFVDDEDEDE